MNLLKIVVKDLKEFIIQKKSIFVILFLSLMISSYGFLFFSSSNMNIAQLMNAHRGVSNNFFISGEILTRNMIEEVIEYLKKNNENITYNVFSDIKQGNRLINTNNAHEANNEKQFYDLIIGTNKNSKSSEDFVGQLISEEDRNICSNYIMIKDTSTRALNDIFILNKKVVINNNSYIVRALDRININIYNYLEYINPAHLNIQAINNVEIGIIPDTTFYKENYRICGLEIIMPKDISTQEKIEIGNFLKQKFNSATVILPQQLSSNLWDINLYMLFYIILMILALINIMALFTYWINKNWKKYMIYRLCGANNSKIYFLILMEALTICIMSIVASILLYYSSIPLLKSLNINYMLSINEVVIISTIIVFLVYINVHLIIRKLLKREIRYLGKR